MSDRSPALEANTERFVRSIGHLLLMKVDPEAAKQRNLTWTTPNEGTAHDAPARSHSHSSAGELRHGA